jgi:DNA-binding GntR family transcriptional regulator
VARELEVRTVVDALVDALRVRILGTSLPGGAAVTETDVAREYDVARPTAKTAIERLVAEGLLTRGAHRSARVPVLDARDVADLYFTRSCLESAALRQVAALPEVPAAAEQADAVLREALGRGDTVGFVEADIAFHRALIDALDAPRLSRLHGGLLAETRLCMAQVQAHLLLAPDAIVAEHRRILEAVASGDAEAAATAVEDHLARARAALLGHLAQH